MEYRIKGNRVIVVQEQLNEYLNTKILELTSMATNLILSIIIISLLVVFNYLMVPTYVFLALILVPLVTRGFLLTKVESWVRKFFGELLQLT